VWFLVGRGAGTRTMTVSKRQRRQAAGLGILLRVERSFWRAGMTKIVGVDEVGVGPLAGPVLAAAVILPSMTFSAPYFTLPDGFG
jgi:ribonuclease HII